MFNFTMKNNPLLGEDTFGQLACYGPERIYLAERRLEMITNHLSRLSKKGKTDRNFPGFDRFKMALKGMHTGENGLGYLQTAVTRFMERFRYVWTKHMSTKWRSNELVWYIIAGEPYLAREFARWLVDYDERDVEDAEDTVDLSNEFAFADVTITLSDVHKMTHGDEKVNVRKLMTYITAEADRAEILKIAFIKRHWSQIKLLAESRTVVRLFDFLDTGKVTIQDESTWSDDDDFTELSEALIRRVFIHSNHQQRCENYVQMMSFLARTNVNESRRTIRAIIVGSIVRRFNPWGLRKVKEMRKKMAKKAPKRLQGKDKNCLYLKYLRHHFKAVDKAKKALARVDINQNDEPGTRRNNIVTRLETSRSKASEIARRKDKERFSKALRQDATQYKAEQPQGIEKPPLIGGEVTLSILTATNNRYLKSNGLGDLTMEDAVLAEIKKRNIKISDRALKKLNLGEKRRKIRDHEFQRLSLSKTELKVKEVQSFKPESDVMKQLINRGVQRAILDKAMGIDALEASLDCT